MPTECFSWMFLLIALIWLKSALSWWHDQRELKGGDVNPHHLQRLQGSSIIHGGRRRNGLSVSRLGLFSRSWKFWEGEERKCNTPEWTFSLVLLLFAPFKTLYWSVSQKQISISAKNYSWIIHRTKMREGSLWVSETRNSSALEREKTLKYWSQGGQGYLNPTERPFYSKQNLQNI